MSNVTLQPDFERIAAEAIVHKAVELGEYAQADPERLRSQMLKSGLMAVVGLFVALGTLGYIVWGPELAAEAATFCVFLLFVSSSLLLFGLLTAAIPLWTTLVIAKLQSIRLESRLVEVESDLMDVEVQLAATKHDLKCNCSNQIIHGRRDSG